MIFDLPIFCAGILVGWCLLIVASDLLGLASIDPARLSRFLTVFLLLSIAGAIGLLALHRSQSTVAPCRPHAAAKR